MRAARGEGEPDAGVWEAVVSRTAHGIAEDVKRLIDLRVVQAGARLPTIRALATRIGVSPTTVTEAWSRLLVAGVIRTEGRRGTFVSPLLGRRSITTSVGTIVTDLASVKGDPGLRPAIGEALARAAHDVELNAHDFAFITSQLQSAVERDWPSDAQAFTAVDGATSAGFLAVQALVPRGAAVAVEQPTPQRMLGFLRDRHIPMVGIDWDAEGPRADLLDRALAEGDVQVFYWQPRVHYPTGRIVSAPRLAELAAVLRAHPEVTVIEDDSVGAASAAPWSTLGEGLPAQVVHIRNYDIAFGLDLRTAVIGGPTEMLRRINRARGMMAVWNSRLLQNALAWLLTDDESLAQVRHAAGVYARRSTAVVAALDAEGVQVDGGGLSLWVPVADEVRALEVLEPAGAAAGLGSVCWLHAADRRHIRVAVDAPLFDGPEAGDVARLVARAARA